MDHSIANEGPAAMLPLGLLYYIMDYVEMSIRLRIIYTLIVIIISRELLVTPSPSQTKSKRKTAPCISTALYRP